MICEATRILAVKEEPSLITELILHLSLVSFLLPVSSSLAAGCGCVSVCVCVGGYGSSECGSVLTALSRIEELDFDHEAGDVTARVRSKCFACA